MKATLFSIAALAVASVAQPHGLHHNHLHNKRDVAVVTNIVTAYATQPAAIVYVDQNNNPLRTEQPDQVPVPAPTSPPSPQEPAAPYDDSEDVEPAPEPAQPQAPSNQASPSPASVNNSPVPEPAQYSPATPETPEPETSAPTPASSPSTNDSPEPNSGSDSGNSGSGSGSGSSSDSGSDPELNGRGISYAPYNSDNSCKTAEQVSNDFAAIQGYGMVRIYGTDCDQMNLVIPAARSHNKKLFVGVWDTALLNQELDLIIDAAQNDWDLIDTVSVGNEGVTRMMNPPQNDNGEQPCSYDVATVVAAMQQARSTLKSAGYNGRIVTVEVWTTVMQNPQLCTESDYAAVNAHSFFDGNYDAEHAGEFAEMAARQVSHACGGMDTVITETGWPSSGETNGKAVPGPANQRKAVDAIRNSMGNNVVLFSAYNEYWKPNNQGTFMTENYWGVLGDSPTNY